MLSIQLGSHVILTSRTKGEYELQPREINLNSLVVKQDAVLKETENS